MSTFTAGADPEFFIRNEDNKLVSAVPIIKGTKHCPELTESGAAMQHDNVAVEFAIPVANSKEEFVDYIGKAMKEVRFALPSGHSIEAISSARFDESELQTEEALEFGCSADYNVWEMCQNNAPEIEDKALRACGGHLHVGDESLLDFDSKMLMVKTMDVFHGIISVMLDTSEEAKTRRKLYGSAGCHRPTEYGIEYRTLSNFWLKSPQLAMLVHHLTEDCLSVIKEGKAEDLISDIGEEEIQDIINEGKVSDAKGVLDNHLVEHLSDDSKIFLDDCLENIKTFDMDKEWAAY